MPNWFTIHISCETVNLPLFRSEYEWPAVLLGSVMSPKLNFVHYCNFSLLFFLEKRHLYSVKHKSWCLCRFFKRKNRFPSREILYSPQLRPLWAFPNLDITIIMIWEQLIAPLIKKAIVAWWCDSHKIEGAHKKVSLSFQEC